MLAVAAVVTIGQSMNPAVVPRCPPVGVPTGAVVDPADCSTAPQTVGVTCRLRCVESEELDSVEMTCSGSRQWISLTTELRCINDTLQAGLYTSPHQLLLLATSRPRMV